MDVLDGTTASSIIGFNVNDGWAKSLMYPFPSAVGLAVRRYLSYRRPSWTGGKIQSSLVSISSSPADSDAGSYAIGGIASRAIRWILGGSSPTFWSSSSSLYGTPVVILMNHGSFSTVYWLGSLHGGTLGAVAEAFWLGAADACCTFGVPEAPGADIGSTFCGPVAVSYFCS